MIFTKGAGVAVLTIASSTSVGLEAPPVLVLEGGLLSPQTSVTASRAPRLPGEIRESSKQIAIRRLRGKYRGKLSSVEHFLATRSLDD
jgi:hypothetical protein